MNNPEFELLVYLITSAKALPEEPACYGSIDRKSTRLNSSHQ